MPPVQNVFWGSIDAKSQSDDIKLTYLKTLVSGESKNAIAKFSYKGTLYKNTLKTLEENGPAKKNCGYSLKVFFEISAHRKAQIFSFTSCIAF